MEKTADALIALLRSALTNTDNEVDATAIDFDTLYFLSNHHDLAHLVCYELEREGRLPETEAGEKFKKRFYSAVFWDVRRTDAEGQLRAIFEKAQIPFVFLKGVYLRGLYPESWMRTSSDIDVLVPENEHEKASDALSRAGMTFLSRGSHDVSYRMQNGIHIELHYTLMEKYRRPQTVEVLRSVWEHTEKTDGGNTERMLDDAFLYYYHIAHMVKHIQEGGCGIRFFMDLYLLLRKDGVDAAGRKKLLEAGDLVPFEAEAVKLAETWFGGAKEDVNALFARFVIGSGIYGTRMTKAASPLANGADTGLSKLFPPVGEMKGRYPVLQKKAYLVPFFYVKRLWTLAAGRLGRAADNEQPKNDARPAPDPSPELKQTIDALLEQLAIE